MHQDAPGPFTLAGIAHRCAQETELFFQRRPYDPEYCFELFRRAIVDGDHLAWEHVYRQYRPLVAGWVTRHSAFAATGEKIDHFVNRAFEKMWGALTPVKFDRFPELRSILKYLQMCVHSVIADNARAAAREAIHQAYPLPVRSNPGGGSPVEDQVLARIRRDEFWHNLNQRLKNDQERCVVYGSFVLALKPRDLYSRHRTIFRDVQEVYRVKENVMVRLRRDSELMRFLDDA